VSAGTRGEKVQQKHPGRARDQTVLTVPIALKFTVFIAVLVVAFMTWQTYIAIDVATSGVEREINKGGVIAVTALSTILDPNWIQDPDNRQKLVQTLGDFSRSPGATQVLNIVVADASGPIATARGESMFRRTMGELIQDLDATDAGVEIREFIYEGMPVRSFARSIIVSSATAPPESARAAEPSAGAVLPVPPGGVVGRIEIYVSAREIAQSRRMLSIAMTKAAITACIVAAIGAFLLARYLTAPIRTLVKDMKQVSLGNLGHKSEVASKDELGDLARAFNSMTAGLQAAQEVKLAQRAMEHELSLASRIQSRLLPSTLPQVECFEIAVHYVPAKEVGGDYYDFVRIDDARLGVVVADVSGKGVPASLVMTMTRSLLRLAARGESSPARTVELVNRFLTPDMNPGMFVTLVYFVLHPAKREIHLVRAGHNAPLFFSAKEKKLFPVQPRGIALGLDRLGTVFPAELKIQALHLEPGDLLVTYTDGVVEAKDPDGKDYSGERLEATISANAQSSAKAIVDAIVKDVELHRRGCEASDDIALVVLKALGA